MFGEPMTLVAPPAATRERPGLSRSRSHSDTSKVGTPLTTRGTAESKGHGTRASHVRSQSYLSPSESRQEDRPRSGHTLPSATNALERTASRLHLPGSSHRHHHKEKDHTSSHHRYTQSHTNVSHPQNNDSAHSLPFRRHRPTQSEAHAPRRFASKEPLSSLPHLVAGLNAERERRTQQQGNPHNGSKSTNRHGPGPGGATLTQAQTQHPFGPSAAQTNDFRPGGRYDYNSPDGVPELRRRATSDPASRDSLSRSAAQPPLRPKTSLEEALERGHAARIARRIHVKKSDILRRDQELQAGEEELCSRVSEINATGVEITRRLDYGYYNLLEKVGNLVSMIGSFQSLAQQSGTLISNFDRENCRISEDTRRRLVSFRHGFDAQQARAQKLAERGTRASARATELSARLEAARLKVEEWENREEKSRRAWDRVWGLCWWTIACVVILVVAAVIGKEWYFRGDPVKAGLRQHGEGSWNKSLRLGGGGEAERRVLLSWDREVVAPNVPEDVKQILAGIAERNFQRKKAFPEVPAGMHESDSYSESAEKEKTSEEDPRLRKLDEL
ncbi:hypothetical protein A1O7_07146 [Cladophialophora yegresii CBS 114405]|uniref:Uncharacterized protein n=1 Tax=Cladophialophora yegresii CBS 114405 TaxID=1182544 RepID=W9VM80_9EURO|nr:uncharacterized protein A1O7_07146 [Cladophialophora yegresii CBS 114405]EXJ56802.1 hypothetical protein A1O7_07146 [Cladophialophora yegresii CBS 114405]